MTSPLMRVASAAVNALLAQDPEARARLAALAGRVFALELRGPELTLYLLPGAAGIDIDTQCEREPDVRLIGTPRAFLEALRGEGGALGAGLEVRGDLRAAQELQAAAAALEPDLEELASRWLGDVAAHQLGRAARGFGAWLREARAALAADAAEYLEYEARVLPHAEEVERFIGEVDELRDDAERLAARIERLEAHRGRGASS